MRVLAVPEGRHVYLRLLKQALTRRGVQVTEAPFPYVRWPGNIVRFIGRMIEGPDLCHLHWNIFDTALGARLFFATRVPKVWTVHNLVPHAPLFREDIFTTHWYLDRVDVAVWHSERTIGEARDLFAARGLPTTWKANNRIIPHMSFNGIWPDTVSLEEARQRIGVPLGAPVVGHFAPTLPYKGTRLFLEAIRRMARKDVFCCIFGACHDPPLAREIRDAAAANANLRIHLVELRDEELQYWFKACNVVVQPYKEVTTSGSIFFPIAFKTPVIATPLGNIPEVIQHGVTGWLANDAESLVRCIKQALEDPTAAREIGERAHSFVNQTANLDLVTSAYLQVYEAALARR